MIESMQRFGAAMAGNDGLVSSQILTDSRSDALVGIATFESREAYDALIPLARAAIKDDPFEIWLVEPIETMLLTAV